MYPLLFIDAYVLDTRHLLIFQIYTLCDILYTQEAKHSYSKKCNGTIRTNTAFIVFGTFAWCRALITLIKYLFPSTVVIILPFGFKLAIFKSVHSVANVHF